jgi:hypothetical protein
MLINGILLMYTMARFFLRENIISWQLKKIVDQVSDKGERLRLRSSPQYSQLTAKLLLALASTVLFGSQFRVVLTRLLITR